jgi:rhodanese-related sulfurtransferase
VSCGTGERQKPAGVIEAITKEVKEKDGVKEITYEQLMKIRSSGDKYILIDVLAEDSYASGHIAGAKNFPVGTIDKESAEKTLPRDKYIVVYCGSFLCKASTAAAKKLGELGYRVLDYKGGLKEWQEKGNPLVR